MTGIVAARADGVSCGESMVKRMGTFQVKQFVVKSERFYNHRLVNGNARLLTDPSAQTSIVSNTGPLTTDAISLLSALKYAK